MATIETSKRKTYEIATYIGSILIVPIIMVMVSNTVYTDWFMYIIGPASILYLIYEMRNFSILEIAQQFNHPIEFVKGFVGRDETLANIKPLQEKGYIPSGDICKWIALWA